MALLLRYSGLRIRDAVCLTRDRVHDGKPFLYTQKTGTALHPPLPKIVLSALNDLTVGVWERTLKRLFTIAGIKDGHAYRFRDTFAVSVLEKGVPIEDVAILLGHQDVRITQKHYSPWVHLRQQRLEENIRKIWA